MSGLDNPYFRPAGTWEEGMVGTDVYQRPTHCPYCGEFGRHTIKRIQGVWFWLKCRKCGRDFKVRSKA